MQNINSGLVLDTHVLLWSILQPEELSEQIKHKINLAQENSQLFLSSISLWEIAMLNFKKRINVYEPIKDFLNSITNINGLSIKDISPEVAAESVSLMDDFHGDPADRIIVATAKCLGATLLTRDQKILSWAKLGHIKSISI
ncbi:PIN domain protein [Rickettsia felis str. Pedreira]|uniref:PIN domain protein n=2 Tax=Rickettsia felis TaxID=42862 RepID=A0A0F3MQL5_RICFI|nr:type II toxin-antitoxin system VapC family toxin [Rickettsia felis]AAY61552.1 Toxin of toxin-antitoxin system [Rickettsia felis URRWXCal2]KHO02946.1 toxin of toxin-antitoxin system [Rickettsia felis str. LSU]KHO03610.1 toxin of toxin-antitoxin system [Rickettsia felis]KJV57727.1 PIN domain protein [Rickettsia felis str. Pedreira]